MAKLETTASNFPSAGRGWSRLWGTMVTEASPANRLPAASSIAGEKSTRHRFHFRGSRLQTGESAPTGPARADGHRRCRDRESAARFAGMNSRSVDSPSLAVQDGIGAIEVVAGVLGRSPEVYGICGHRCLSPNVDWSLK